MDGDVLVACRGWVLKSLECFCDVPWHGQVAGAFLVIPSEGEAAIGGTSPINGHFVFGGNDIDQMLGMFAANVLYAKIINHETESDGAGCVFEQTGSVRALKIAVLG
jgi:hypothetical protein